MSLETIGGGNVKFVTTLKEGEVIQGFLMDVVKEKNKFNSEQYNFIMKDESGSEFKVVSGGTAKYFAKNVASALGKEPVDEKFKGAIEDAKRCLGSWVVMSVAGEYTNKTGQKVKQIKVQLDSSKVPF